MNAFEARRPRHHDVARQAFRSPDRVSVAASPLCNERSTSRSSTCSHPSRSLSVTLLAHFCYRSVTIGGYPSCVPIIRTEGGRGLERIEECGGGGRARRAGGVRPWWTGRERRRRVGGD